MNNKIWVGGFFLPAINATVFRWSRKDKKLVNVVYERPPGEDYLSLATCINKLNNLQKCPEVCLFWHSGLGPIKSNF